ncbi:MAG: hypothetical protein ACI8SJ_000493 [Shewanella sp.]|jgi:hypothetical protein
MNYKLLGALLAGSLALTACSSDDDTVKPDPVEPPPVDTAIDIADALAINLTVSDYDTNTGALSFKLTDAAGLAITNVKDYDITYMGFPDPEEKSNNPKAWKRWHVTQKCASAVENNCQSELTELATKGSYSFAVTDLDLSLEDATRQVKLYKVAIQINGAQASNDVELISPTATVD